MEASTEEDKVLINCLEHVSLREGLVFVLDDYCVCFCAQALALSKDMVA
jgi:hypothetical protein